MEIKFIKSRQNYFFKLLKKLQISKHRKKEGLFLVEGEKCIAEALKRKELVKFVVMSEKTFQEGFKKELTEFPIYVLDKRLFKEVSELISSQNEVILVMKEPKDLVPNYEEESILIDRIQDPANLGGILRVLDAVGYKQAFLTKGTVDPYSFKAVRASAGSIFHVKVFLEVEGEDVINNFKDKGFEIWATTPHEGENLFFLKPNKKVLLIVGNEGQGIDSKLLKLADRKVYVPILGNAESLNVTVCTAVVLYYFYFCKEVVKNKI